VVDGGISRERRSHFFLERESLNSLFSRASFSPPAMAADCRRPSDPPDLNPPVVLPCSIDRPPLEQSTNYNGTLTSRSDLQFSKEQLDSQFPPLSDLKGKGVLDPSSSDLRDRDILVSRQSANPDETVSLDDKHVEDTKNPKTTLSTFGQDLSASRSILIPIPPLCPRMG